MAGVCRRSREPPRRPTPPRADLPLLGRRRTALLTKSICEQMKQGATGWDRGTAKFLLSSKRAPFEALARIYPGEYGATGEIEIRRVFELEGFDASNSGG